jgi:succinate-semialdehyde dehydrogenase/glutarate-semialdehyde dehydrogenase
MEDSPVGGLPVPDEHVPVVAKDHHPMFVGGRWCDAADGTRFDVEDPATEQVLATVADAGAVDAVRALDSAVAAGAEWAATPARARSEQLRRAFDQLMQRTDEFARWITAEMGKPLDDARAEVGYAADFVRWFAEEAVRVPGRFTPAPDGATQIVVTGRPVGPCYLVTPWNFPLAMATRKLAPALAAGCTAVLKPAELTPLTSLLFADLLMESGLPAGVVNVVTTTRPAEVSAALLADPRLRKLSFTGSTAVGRALLAQAAPRVLRTSMELGGNAPFLVFDDADLDSAVAGAMLAKFRNGGQACTAANRFLVHADVAEPFTDRIVERVAALRLGPGNAAGTDVGPLVDARAVRKIDELVQRAVAQGARVLAGGRPVAGRGHFFEPTVLADVSPQADILAEEIFGPVVVLTSFVDERHAVELANATEYGLASYVYTRDVSRAHRMIDALDAGMTGINTGLISNAAAPFGGVKQSGTGREGGTEGLQEYLETRYAAFGGQTGTAATTT